MLMIKMKDSKIEWIGQIPENWKIIPIYTCTSEVTQKNSDLKEKRALKFTYGNIVDKTNFNIDEDSSLTQTASNYLVVKPNDIVINGLNLNYDFITQRVGMVKKNGIITSAYMGIRPNQDDIIPKYLLYLFKTYDAEKAFHNMGGGVRKILNYSELKKEKMILPSLLQQQTIADFLDKKCTEIDELSTKIQQEILDLKEYQKSLIYEMTTKGLSNDNLVDSPIPFFKKVNKNWSITKIGHICTKLNRTFNANSPALLCSNNGKVIYRPEAMKGKMLSEDHAMQGIHQGDIAIHGMDTWHGAIALSNYNGKITRVVHVCQSTEDNRFMVYYLQTLAYLGVYKLISNGVRGNTSDFRSWNKVKNIPIPIPSRKEQQDICDYLDKVNQNIENILDMKQQILSKIAKYKNSLIYEYVTGKKQVPNLGEK